MSDQATDSSCEVSLWLEPDPARPRYFITEARMGYRFDPEKVGERGASDSAGSQSTPQP